MASDGRASMATVSPAWRIQMVAWKVSSRRSETTTLLTRALRPAMIAQEVVGHGARGGGLFDLERDGVGFEEADPDGEDEFAGEVVEDDDGHVGGGVHHEAADGDFDLGLGEDHTASPTSELGKIWVMRTST